MAASVHRFEPSLRPSEYNRSLMQEVEEMLREAPEVGVAAFRRGQLDLSPGQPRPQLVRVAGAQRCEFVGLRETGAQ